MMPKVPCKPILLVEDDPYHADMITEALESAKLANPITAVHSGQAALDYFFEGANYDRPRADRLMNCPCLVVLDLNLPDMEGVEVLKRLKHNRVFEMIPVMILTTSTNDRDIKRSFDYQANAYVTKPVDFHEFFEKVRLAGLYWIMINEPVPA